MCVTYSCENLEFLVFYFLAKPLESWLQYLLGFQEEPVTFPLPPPALSVQFISVSPLKSESLVEKKTTQ